MSNTQSLQRRQPQVVAAVHELAPELLHKLMTEGNLAGLTIEQRTAYYAYRCQLLGLDVATQPFDLINLQGKLTLYAKKECSSQLASKRNLSATIVNQGVQGDLYVVQARVKATDGRGRETDDLGAVTIKGKTGDDLCNAMMKAATKAKRRAILTHCGLGMLDESELETVRSKWGDSGSQAAAQAVATEKLAEMGATAPPDAGPALDIREDELPPADVAKGQETTPKATVGPRPMADPRKGAFLYREQAQDLKAFTVAKKIVGEVPYRTCLAAHKVSRSLEFQDHAAAEACMADLRETAKAQKAQAKLKADREADREMDAASLPCHRANSGCDIVTANQIARAVKELGTPFDRACMDLTTAFQDRKREYPESPDADHWRVILIALEDVLKRRSAHEL